MFTISKEYGFSAAHHLTNVAPGHPCAGNHGHNYRVVVEVSADDLDGDDWLIDYAEIDEAVEPLLNVFDHADLNALIDPSPTAERLALTIFRSLEVQIARLGVKLTGVGVSETERTWAWFRPSP